MSPNKEEPSTERLRCDMLSKSYQEHILRAHHLAVTESLKSILELLPGATRSVQVPGGFLKAGLTARLGENVNRSDPGNQNAKTI